MKFMGCLLIQSAEVVFSLHNSQQFTLMAKLNKHNSKKKNKNYIKIIREVNCRVIASTHAKFYVYFSIRTYFFYFTQSLFKTPNIDYLFYNIFH